MSLVSLSFAPWVPSRKKDILRALKIVSPKENDVLYDLGCGNGTVIFQTAKTYPIKKAVGIEIAAPLYFWCKIRLIFEKKLKERVEFRNENIFIANISEASIVYVFGMPEALEKKLRPKLEKELKPGTKIVSYVFPIEGWVPELIDKPKNQNPIYLYIKK
jgi:SAM-dependent methyltransferase